MVDELKNIVEEVFESKKLRIFAKVDEEFESAKWKATVENARACLSSGRMYCYIDPKHKTGVVFNILGSVLELCSGSYYYRTSTLSEKQKADADILLESAYRNWGEVKAFDDQNSLQQHLAGLSTHMDPSLKPDFPGGAAAEMVGESSSGCSYPSFHSATSTMNLFGEAGEQDFGSLGSVCDDRRFVRCCHAMYSRLALQSEPLRRFDERVEC